MYDDRQFCNGHRTVTKGMPMGYLVSGALEAEQNLKTIIEARARVGGNFLAGVASDESAPDSEIDKLANTLGTLCSTNTPARKFLRRWGLKIFRDLIWLCRA